jgi:transposase-like protein
MSKTRNRYSPEVRDRAVWLVLDHEGEHSSRWAAVTSIAAKIGCTPQTLHDWVKKADRDSSGRATDVSSEKMKALERENRELKQANEILRKASAPRRSSTAGSSHDRVHRRSPRRQSPAAGRCLIRAVECHLVSREPKLD